MHEEYNRRNQPEMQYNKVMITIFIMYILYIIICRKLLALCK